MTELLMYLCTESPTHVGIINGEGPPVLRIQREPVTGYPVISALRLKGTVRAAAREADWNDEAIQCVFGGPAARGMLSITDAHLVALPVPTLRRTFVWATSQIMLARLARKYRAVGLDSPPVPGPPPGSATAASVGWTGPQGKRILGPRMAPVAPLPDRALAAWADRIARDAIGETTESAALASKLRSDLLAVGSDVMSVLSSEGMEVTAQVRISDAKTVESDLFYIEYLPANTIMATSILLRSRGVHAAGENLRMLTRLLHGNLVQVGGGEMHGRGLARARILKAGN